MCHSICVFILYRLRNVAAYWYKIVTFYTLFLIFVLDAAQNYTIEISSRHFIVIELKRWKLLKPFSNAGTWNQRVKSE